MKSKVVSKMRQRRDAREFERTMHDASPSMRHELMVLAARHDFTR
ncbi:MAG: hypothetical protein ABJB98_01805 [Actinomycetota bacterium]